MHPVSFRQEILLFKIKHISFPAGCILKVDLTYETIDFELHIAIL